MHILHVHLLAREVQQDDAMLDADDNDDDYVVYVQCTIALTWRMTDIQIEESLNINA